MPKNTKKTDTVKAAPLIDHLAELRRRLIACLIVFLCLSGASYFFAEHIYNFLAQPLVDAMGQGHDRRFIYTGLAEVFFTYMKLAFFTGGFLSFPVLAFHVWQFMAPGLYKNEKRLFFPLLILTPFLFFLGAAFVYIIVFPMAWSFFLGFETFNTAMPIQLEAKIDEYLGIVMKLMFAFGLAFELPIFLFLLARAGFVSVEFLRQKRKYAVIIAFIAAAILTPPDVISQIALAVPILILYELSILLIGFTTKNRYK